MMILKTIAIAVGSILIATAIMTNVSFLAMICLNFLGIMLIFSGVEDKD